MSVKHAQLSISERKRLDAFLKSTDEVQLPARYSYLFASALAMIGLFLFSATTVIAVDYLNSTPADSLNDIDFWMFLSGLIAGAAIIAVGLISLIYAGYATNRNELASIVRKLSQEAR